MSHKAPTPCPTTYCHHCNGRGSWFIGWLWWKTLVECEACGGTGKPTAADLAKYGKPPYPPSAPPPPPPPRAYLLRSDKEPTEKNKVYLPDLDAPVRFTEARYHEDGTIDRGRPSDETHRQMLKLEKALKDWAAHRRFHELAVSVHDTTELDRA